jgi:hypothetical protein
VLRKFFEDEDGILIYAPFQVLEPSKRIRKSNLDPLFWFERIPQITKKN